MDHDCPQGGDIANDCNGCPYNIEYHYSPIERDCVLRPEVSLELKLKETK